MLTQEKTPLLVAAGLLLAAASVGWLAFATSFSPPSPRDQQVLVRIDDGQPSERCAGPRQACPPADASPNR